MVYPSPFLNPAFGDPFKDIAAKMGENLSGWQIYRRANFHVDRRPHLQSAQKERDTGRKNITADLIIIIIIT